MSLMRFGMIVIVRIVMIVVTMIRVIVPIMFFMVCIAFQLNVDLGNGTVGCIGYGEQIERGLQERLRRLNRCKVLVTLGLILKPYNISAGGRELHRDAVRLDRDIQCADPVFMRIQLARLIRECRPRCQCHGYPKCSSHDLPNPDENESQAVQPLHRP